MNKSVLANLLCLTLIMVLNSQSQAIIDGAGTANRIPKFQDPDTLGDSAIYELGGNVGIGTTSPTHRLHIPFVPNDVYGPEMRIGHFLYLHGLGDGAGPAFVAGMHGFQVDNPLLPNWAEPTATSAAFLKAQTTGLYYYFDDNLTVGSRYHPTPRFYVKPSGDGYFSGKVGIGTTNPVELLHLSKVDNHNYSPTSFSAGTTLLIDNTSNNNDGVAQIHFQGMSDSITNGAAIGMETNTGDSALFFQTEKDGAVAEAMRIACTGNVGIGTISPGKKLTVRGNILIENASGTAVAELGEGLDYAEGFDVSQDEKVTAGTVLVLDELNPGKLKVCDQAYDKKVAGIASGAKGLGSGVRLGVGQFDCDVALAGRVYCNVDATDHAVEVGDPLTTSDLSGYAMKAVDLTAAQCAILGKAMQSLEKGQKGQILVLVTLQ